MHDRVDAVALVSALCLALVACEPRSDISDGSSPAAADARHADQPAADAASADTDKADQRLPDAGAADNGGADMGAADSAGPDLAAADAGAPDSAGPDLAAADAGALDSASVDNGATDAGGSDSTCPDHGAADAAAADAGAVDNGVPDLGAVDAGAADAGAVDRGAADNGAADSASPDLGSADAGATDFGIADSSSADGGAVDASAVDASAADSNAADALLGACIDNPCDDSGDVDAACDEAAPPAQGYSCRCSAGYVDSGVTCAPRAVRALAVLYLGSNESRFWHDIHIAYHVLRDAPYDLSDEEVVVLTPALSAPADVGFFDDAIIDGLATKATLDGVVDAAAATLGPGDHFFLAFDGHGTGYYGPETRRPYWPGPLPDDVYDDPSLPIAQYDDPDFFESELKVELIESGCVDGVKYCVDKGINKWQAQFRYYPHMLTVGRYTRFMIVPDGRGYFVKRTNYARADLNRDGELDADEIVGLDADDDGVVLAEMFLTCEPYAECFDEDDWSDDFVEEPFLKTSMYAMHGVASRCYYQNSDGGLSAAGFASGSDPTYLACLAQTATPEELAPYEMLRDADNDGYSDFFDVNLDRDLNDLVSFDEDLSGLCSDDDLAALFARLAPGTVRFFLTQSCFGGGLLEDLARADVIGVAAAEEGDTSSGNLFIRGFFAGMHGACELYGAPTEYPGMGCEWYRFLPDVDLDGDGLISMTEAFRQAVATVNGMNVPLLNDNADRFSSRLGELAFYPEGPADRDGYRADTYVFSLGAR